ncbi:hypothetical protein LEP1GSC161_1641 [Leptospira santarosai str. CBC1416]|uniref:Uncharacterized protein n=3 Tax=Leptospira santarosai TaxID=28183 RepID=A0A0E2BHW9_9LEPT|nr:hypothetical protein LEP1GSC179_3466 [Leptospira santarosai str. MOR084]EKO80108.1 hypothetical protein LEP1GSC068_2431 [Leptospira sp. Fiocruz LV3954]EKS08402.1 hypothetical protein LEP1GSC071_2223 [Leptospira santarosai str. JET]EMF90638.1 hypothetical protein LEP1GSC005_3449 [Leptospira santarosai str. ST188]EMI67425.1 hypothetical protein LEP1GSC076_1071 [Leptospira sp. Fiocruz LV4135]EMM75805.1 hypothetical protein LEP1GSC040_3056 [Leptospira santarosai str. 2000030832]EMM85547.1 hypo
MGTPTFSLKLSKDRNPIPFKVLKRVLRQYFFLQFIPGRHDSKIT